MHFSPKDICLVEVVLLLQGFVKKFGKDAERNLKGFFCLPIFIYLIFISGVKPRVKSKKKCGKTKK